ncbi:MAG: hypothetical protein IPG66_08685 [Hydrogenophilales bacterium]|nr:hypothetical protein [Hydrogenophilales bacterium]
MIQKLSDTAYLFLEAKTVQGAGTFGNNHVYHVQPPQPGDSESYLANDQTPDWAATNGHQLEIHVRGANFDEVSYWERVFGTYSERYLDRAVMQAAENYKLRQPGFPSER